MKALLLCLGLEATVSELAAGIDELDVERSGLALGRVESLPESQHPLLGADGTTLQHEPVLGDNTIVGETTNGGDALLGVIVLGGGGRSSGLVVRYGRSSCSSRYGDGIRSDRHGGRSIERG